MAKISSFYKQNIARVTNTSEIVFSHQIMKGLWHNFYAADSPNTQTKTEAFDEVCMTKSCEKMVKIERSKQRKRKSIDYRLT
jgi:hypothetical protein